ncbi:MAG: AI-2E family transporter [Paracoccus sp. (in: a-proteobacteria)]|uniref:AI-2E family transporter n=1 Tax=Paracoccus sp. TaxID=267 RepID=UPI0026DEB827|nr:AI-2E family transporter [Paracoccus sp. (in: a-proteobacteria)]MDO5622290.1 AI-2E family transporter [Paracoccus sp. (in: a-proteobacteria)]
MRQPNPYTLFPVGKSEATPKPIPGWAVVGIFLILLFFFVSEARDFLMPVSLAVLMFFIFVPVRRMLEKIGLVPAAAAAIILMGIIAGLAALGWAISGPAGDLIARAPQLSTDIAAKLAELRNNFSGLEQAAATIDEMSSGTGGTGDAPSTLQTLLNFGPGVTGQIVFTLFLLFFMLASGDLLYLKIVQSFDGLTNKKRAYIALREIEASLGSYMGTITIINACLGIAVGTTMWIWGMPSPLLFGLGAFLFNFIPYLGSIGGIAVSFLVALVSFDDLWTPTMIALTYLACTAIEGQLITPYFVSRRLSLNTVVVFLTVALWAWLWSILGMVVAVPMLVVIRVMADHIPGLEKFGNFLAGEDPPELEDENEEQARDIVEPAEHILDAKEAEQVALAADGTANPDAGTRSGGTIR